MTPRTVAHQVPLSMGFSRHKYWSWLPFPPPGDIPILEIESVSPALAGGFFTTDPPEKPIHVYVFCILADKVNILKLQGQTFQNKAAASLLFAIAILHASKTLLLITKLYEIKIHKNWLLKKKYDVVPQHSRLLSTFLNFLKTILRKSTRARGDGNHGSVATLIQRQGDQGDGDPQGEAWDHQRLKEGRAVTPTSANPLAPWQRLGKDIPPWDASFPFAGNLLQCAAFGKTRHFSATCQE